MRKKTSFIVFSAFLFILLTSSCEIGLGSSVDTETPVFSITFPNVEKGESPIIRDKFKIKGNWSDDGEIQKVEIIFTKTDGTFTSPKYIYKGNENDTITLTKDSLENKGEWSCLIDYEKDNLPDGTYSVRVIFEDFGGHKAENSCQITIDNTAPLIVLQRPAAPDSLGKPDSYGQTFTLVGQAADDNTISLIEVNIYEDENKTSTPYVISLNNVPLSINLDVAKFEEGNSESEYAKIYGSSSKNGDQIRFCNIVAYDEAQRYPIDGTQQSEEDKKGNKQNYYYLYEDIASSVLSNHKITEIYAMLADRTINSTNRSSSSSSKDYNDVMKILNDSRYQITLGTFSLNPANNPNFSVAGRSQLTGNESFFTLDENKISNNSEVVIEVGVGLDSYPLDETSLKPYALECDKNGVPINDAKIYFGTNDESNIVKQKSGTSYKFITKISTTDGFIIGRKYIFGVDGKDQNSNVVMPVGKGYGFSFISSGAAPTLTITNPVDSTIYLKKGDNLVFTGEVSVEDGDVDVILTYPDETAANKTATKIITTQSGKFEFSHTIGTDSTQGGFAQNESKQYKYKIAATQGVRSAESERTVMYDVIGPVIDVLSVYPTAEKYNDDGNKVEGTYLNGDVSIKVSITDAFDTVNQEGGKSQWVLYEKSNPNNKTEGLIDRFPSQDIKIDTTKVNGDVCLKIRSYDRAGNLTEFTQDYNIDQSTDLPRIFQNNANLDLKLNEKSVLTSNVNTKNKITMGGQLVLKYYDDDGAKSIEVRQAKLEGNTELSDINWNSLSLDAITQESLSNNMQGTYIYSLPNETGVYGYKITITDINDKKNEYPPFVVKMTATAPILSNVTTNRDYTNIAKSIQYENKIEFTAHELPYILQVKNGESWTEVVRENSNSEKSVLTHKLTSPISENTTFTYRIVDGEGKPSNEKSVECKIDNTPPTVTIEKLDNKIKKNALRESPYRFEGNFTDSLSGIDKVYYMLCSKTDEEPTTSDLSSWSQAETGSRSWYKEITLTEGLDQVIYVCAVDNAGNISTVVSKEFDVDFAEPTIVSKIIVGEKTPEELTNSLTKTINEKFSLELTIEDSNKLDETTPLSVIVKKDDVTLEAEKYNIAKDELQSTLQKTIYTFTFVNETTEDGVYTFDFTGKDIAGKTSTISRTIALDTIGPIIEIQTPDFNEWQLSNDITVRGTANDLSGVKAVYYHNMPSNVHFSYSIENPLSDDSWKMASFKKATGTTNWSMKLDSDFLTDGEKNKLWILAVDKNGMISEEYEYSIKIDSEDPSFTETESERLTEGTYSYGYGEDILTSKIRFGGIAQDSTSGIQSIKIIQEGTENEYDVELPAVVTSEWNYEFSKIGENRLTDGVYNYKFTATDNAGRTSYVQRTIKLDTQLPAKPSITVDTNGIEVTKGSTTKKWYKTQQLSITVSNVSDIKKDGYESGISSVEYSFNPNAQDANWIPLTKNGNNWKANIYCDKQGRNSFTVRVKDNVGNIQKSDSHIVYIDTLPPLEPEYYYVGDEENFTGTKLVNGKNDLIIEQIDILDDDRDGRNTISDIASITYKNDTSVTGEYDFDWKVVIPHDKIKNGNAIFTITDNAGNSCEWKPFFIEVDNTEPKVTISSPLDEIINGTLNVSGNIEEQNPKSISLYYRTSEPTGTALTTLTGWTLIPNATKTIGENGVTISDVQKFTFADVDFNTLSGANSSAQKQADIWILPYAEDEAGNFSQITGKISKFTVDLESDRPIITFNDIELNDLINGTATGFENSTIKGNISDDDGAVTALYCYVGDEINASTNWGSAIEMRNGTFKIENLEDGLENVWFKVIDAKGAEFISSASDTYDVNSVILVGSDNKSVGRRDDTKKSSLLKVTIDTSEPDSKDLAFKYSDSETWETSSVGSVQFGGTKNLFDLQEWASDANGVKSVKLELPVVSGDSSVTGFDSKSEEGKTYIYNFAKSATPDANDYYAWTKSSISVSGMKSGSRSGTLRISDGIKEKTISINIQIDNDAPTLNIESHNENDQVRAGFLLKGSIAEGDLGTTVKYQTSLTNTAIAKTDENWKELHGTTSMNFRVYFDGEGDIDEYSHEPLPKNLIVDLRNDVKIATTGVNAGKVVKTSDDSLFTQIVPIYFHFLVTDKLGNQNNEKVLCLKLDPQGDIPTVTMTYPEPTLDEHGEKHYEITSSGIIRASGFAEDDKTIVGIYMQIDPNYNAATGFANNWESKKLPGTTGADVGKSLSNYDDSKYHIEDIGSKLATPKTLGTKGIYIGNGLSWNFALNTKGEFNASDGTTESNKIAIRLYAVDVDGNVSVLDATDKSKTMIITLDSDAPQIGSSEPLSLYRYGWKNNAGQIVYTNVPNPKSSSPYFASNDPGCSGTSAGNITSVTNSPDTTKTELTKVESITIGGTTYAREFSSIAYSDNMWLKGEWFLQGSVEDSNGINEITMDNVDIKSHSIATQLICEDGNDYYIIHRVGNKNVNEAGTLSYSLKVVDSQEKNNGYLFKMNYDNKPPVLKTTDESHNIKTSVLNSNGFYLVQSVAEEGNGESGFKRAVFFFKRGENTVYDSYISKNVTGNKLTIGTGANDVTIDETGLYWKQKTVSAVNGNIVTINSTDENVHVGGLAKLGGTVYRINGVSADGVKITLDKMPSESLAGQKIAFTIGHVVDHSGTESTGQKSNISDDEGYGKGYYKSLQDDDGDRMVEKVQTIGQTTIWNGAINSRNIPDGNIEIHYVVFDEAGNYASGVVNNAKVENNAPRLAGVTVWTDYNGNGKGWRQNHTGGNAEFTAETNSKYVSRVRPTIGKVKVDKSNAVMDTNKSFIVSSNDMDDNTAKAFMKVTDTVKVIPEIVGGNGKLYYSYDIQNSQNSGRNLSGKGKLKNDSNVQIEGTDDGGENLPEYTDEDSITYIKGHTDGVITFDGAEILSSATGIGNSSTDVPAWFNIKIWDSTEGATVGSGDVNTWNSLNCEMKIALNNQYNDTTKPTAAINPFYWNSKDDNSLVWDENGKPQGHIELEDDLTDEIKNTTVGATKLGDDPKVSGRIKVEGTAEDNIRLKSLTVTFATHSELNGGQTITYSNGSWSTAESGTDYKFIAQDISSNSDGHKVKWTLEVDTSKITNVAELDKAFTIVATDERGASGGNVSVGSTVQTKVNKEEEDDNLTPYYKVDVVPYVTELTTTLTKLNKKQGSLYGRTALGLYPIYAYKKNANGTKQVETVLVKGFNIQGASVKLSGVATPIPLIGANGNEFSITDTSRSGKISFVNNNVESLNNINNNDAKGSVDRDILPKEYINYSYNKQPNEQNNYYLTDDIELAIWDINSQAAKSKTGELSEVVMHVNPSNGMLGFAFAHSQDLASYPNGNTNSYNTWITDWTGVNQIGFIYDSKGNMFGTNGGTDTYTPSKKAGRFGLVSSKWGTISTNSASDDMYSGYTRYRRLRLEYLGLTQNGVYSSNVYRFAKGDCSQFAVSTPTTSNTNMTNLYMMYYDNTLSELKFKAGQYNNDWSYGNNWGTDVNLEGAGFSKAGFSFGDFADDAYNQTGGGTNYNPNYATTSIVANNTSNARAGIYYSIAAISSTNGNSDKVVAVWYDDFNKTLWYSYIENPLANAGDRNKAAVRNMTTGISTEWSTPVAILDGHAGGYCAIATDEDGHIHIASYSRDDAGSLYYAYLDKYNSTFNAEKNLVKVDSYGSSGQYITMEVAKDIYGKTIPYIGFWMNSMSYPKYTYLVDTASSQTGATYYPKAGVDEEGMYTGAWESVILPTSSSIVLDDINIGLYKYQTAQGGHVKGEIREIPIITESAGDVSGIAGGNGSSNPVLGYGISYLGHGYIETAQIRSK